MRTDPPGLSSSECENIEQFLHLFADVEKSLKVRLGRRVDDPTGVRILIDRYTERNPYWTDFGNQLRNLAEIRNLLTHQRGTICGYPIAVAPSSLHALRQVKEHLLRPEPVSVRFRKTVTTVAPGDSLAKVLALAFENGFSQFPVVSDGRFGGLITENEIVRWLGHRTRCNSTQIDLSSVTVKVVLKEKDPYLRGLQIFHFEKLDAPVEEVMGRFSTEPALEVVLLTNIGGKTDPVEGIITQWDAARYPG